MIVVLLLGDYNIWTLNLPCVDGGVLYIVLVVTWASGWTRYRCHMPSGTLEECLVEKMTVNRRRRVVLRAFVRLGVRLDRCWQPRGMVANSAFAPFLGFAISSGIL
jgi:hypothetical protein